jgi:hypothetical protein
MKSYFLLSFFVTLLLSGCHRSGQRINEISKIEIETGGCFGPCQSTVVSIDSSLVYKYYGGSTSFVLPLDAKNDRKLNGYFLGKVSHEFWDTLNIKLENIKYKQLDTIYKNSVDDQSLEIFIYYGDKIKHIKAQSASLPVSVAHVFYYIIRSYKTIRPKPTKDTFIFESTIHKSIPDIRQVKFPPPVKNWIIISL